MSTFTVTGVSAATSTLHAADDVAAAPAGDTAAPTTDTSDAAAEPAMTAATAPGRDRRSAERGAGPRAGPTHDWSRQRDRARARERCSDGSCERHRRGRQQRDAAGGFRGDAGDACRLRCERGAGRGDDG
jgi:hypothetical protein